MAQSAISYPRKFRYFLIPDHTIGQFRGINTILSDLQKIGDGYSPDAMNWVTGDEKDCIILRRGTNLLGQTRIAGSGGITGLGVGVRNDGTQVPFFQYGQKVKYYNLATDDTVEVGSNMLPAAAATDEFSIYPYSNLAGDFVYLSSINSSIYKIPVANPGSAVDQSSTTYRGFLKFGQSRSILWNRKGTNGLLDNNNLYMSWVDAVSLATSPPFTTVTAEAIGSSGSTTYAGTLATISGVRTAAQVQIMASVAAGTETFLDNKNGVLVSNYGGAGTINYATGAYSVTFSDVTTGAVTANYYYETANSHGVCDFSFTSPVRVAGEGRFYSQFDGGGALNSVFPLANVFYSFHELKTWQTTIPTDDNDAGTVAGTNLPFREKMGVSSPFAAFGTSTGIYYINNANPTRPEVYQLRLFTGTTAANVAAPKLISEALNLSQYDFDKAIVFEWGKYVLLCCQQIRNGSVDNFNSRMFVYNTLSGVWDITDYPASRLAEYGGTLISGDPLSNNIFTLFSGFDDDGNLIPNWWTSGATDHGVKGQKTTMRMTVNGLIQSEQSIKVGIALDGGKFVDIFTIAGNGSYVDSGKSIAVGTNTVGSKIAGGGEEIFANPFEVEFALNTDRYEYIRVRFEALSGGWAQINYYTYKMNKLKGERVSNARLAS